MIQKGIAQNEIKKHIDASLYTNIPIGIKSKKMEKILSSVSKIRFQDCDPFNHLNNAKYLDYFMNAREDQILENYQLDVFGIAQKEGRGWLVTSNQISYLRPAFTMETVLIDSQLIRFTEKSLLVEMRMWDADRRKLKSLLWANFVHFDFKSTASINHPAAFQDFCNAIVLPVEQASFEERNYYMMQQYKTQAV